MTNEEEESIAATWRGLSAALRSPQPFNPFLWIYRLARALQRALFRRLGIPSVSWKHRILPLIPIFAISLVTMCALSYPLSIRPVIKERWCCWNDSKAAIHGSGNKDTISTCEQSACPWLYIHDLTILYLPTMILYHFISACFSSPGVVVTKNDPGVWKASLNQGGFAGCNPTFDPAAEERRVALYGFLEPVPDTTANTSQHDSSRTESADTGLLLVYPSPRATYCSKCEVRRPARSHHCSTSNRCVLQFDHYCIWLNNSIGYCNYRSFFLLLFYIMITCWYGAAMLFHPFYEPLKMKVKEHGWRWLYSNGTGLLDLPPLLDLVRMATSGALPAQAVIDILYPLLLGVGAIISAFFGSHVKYVLLARTTLEHRVLLERSMINLFHKGSVGPTPSNPFDQGQYGNLVQVLGSNPLLALLPVPIRIPNPFIPKATVQSRLKGQ